MPGIEESAPVETELTKPVREVRVGIIGYGTVGRASAQILTEHAEEIRRRTGGVCIRVTRACRRTEGADLGDSCIPVVADWRKVVYADDVDIIVEAIGGINPAHDVVRCSIEASKPVVTANKSLIAQHGEELFALADRKRVPIGIEATVGGGIPIVRTMAEALAADRVRAVYGIVNGTANFILTQMENNQIQFEEALKQAQTAGYAEADPSLDIDGIDARDKISILARLAFNASLAPADIPVTGIRRVTATDFHYARRLDGTIRLVAMAEKNAHGISVSVSPWLVGRDSMLAKVDGPNNAIFLAGEKVGTQMLYGRGAGGGATGTAVLSDVVEIAKPLARGHSAPKGLPGFHKPQDIPLVERMRPVSWYLRLTVRDHPGVLAHVAEAIAHQDINIDSVIQEPMMHKERLSFVITLEPVTERVVSRAVQTMNQFEFMREPVLVLPITSSAGEND